MSKAPKPSQVAASPAASSPLRRICKQVDSNLFHCSEVRNMDKATFIKFVQDCVVPSVDSGDRATSQKRVLAYFNALHNANLLLQKRTMAFGLVLGSDDEGHCCANAEKPTPQVVGTQTRNRSQDLWKRLKLAVKSPRGIKVSRQASDPAPTSWTKLAASITAGASRRRELIEKCKDPLFMLDFGPVGDIPLHVAFLLGKCTLGRDMLAAVESSPAWWRRCEELVKQWGPGSDLPELPRKELRNTANLRSWVLNIPYQNDLRWWLDEFGRREQYSDEDGREVRLRFHSQPPTPKRVMLYLR